ncbi:hypothetical protein CDAR_81541 [Caerostris darwini]|uniref:Uncharacterized protein n=1 Tax=Caerostris darwini TaxID=1538125 RepID=A0AAV4TDL6_9ARAC|nr:hypothetical protein CDAR_81541 [Caerostris darwini]
MTTPRWTSPKPLQLSNSDFLFSHPAPQSAATNIKSPTWERNSLTIEECSRRIRAICTYTGVPASHLPAKKELAELKKAKELRDKIAAEAQLAAEAHQAADAQQAAVTTPIPALPQQPQSATPTPKRKAPASPTPDDDFVTVVSKKDRKNRVSTRTQPSTFTSRTVQPAMAFSQILRQGNEEKSVGPAPQPIIAREPLPAACCYHK